jgi:hypothetical protein
LAFSAKKVDFKKEPLDTIGLLVDHCILEMVYPTIVGDQF